MSAAATENEKTSPHDALAVSWPVQYWGPPGSKQDRLPQVALVQRNCGDGMLYLLAFGPGGGTATLCRNVWHTDSLELKERPNLRTQYGVWDYVPGLVPTAVTESPAAAEESEVPESKIDRVLDLHRQGVTASEIAKKLQTKKVTIEAIIEQHAGEPAGAPA